MLDGYFQLPWWGYVLVTLVMTHISIVSVTVFLHRHQTHRALDLHPAVSHFFRFWLCLTTGVVTKQWVAVHRKHHANVETHNDPHSPQILGIKKVLWSGAEVYGYAHAQHPEILELYGQGTPDDWLERYVYGRVYATWVGIFLLEACYVILFGPIGITMWAIQMMWIPFFAAGVINGMTHWWGYRNHACPDASTNLVPWGILIGGEELHNNHHAFASSAKFSSRPWEFDISWFYIRILCALGLARVKKVAPTLYRHPSKSRIDKDTMQAITTHRLEVVSDYSKQVLGKVYKDEFSQATDGDYTQFEPLDESLKRSLILKDRDARQRLARKLRESPVFFKAYHFQTRLNAIGQGSDTSFEKSLQDLKRWCQQAKTSGIKSLEKFAEALPGYSMQSGRSTSTPSR